MSDWLHILITIIAGVGGAVFGYLTGLQRAGDAYREAGIQPPTPTRERTIKECIAAITTQANYCFDPMQLQGIEVALETLRSMDKRRAGQVADAISRRALDKAADPNVQEGLEEFKRHHPNAHEDWLKKDD